MKALSLLQPWAWLIVTPDPARPHFPLKDVENRSWRLPALFTLPRRIYVHASATWVDIPSQIHQRLERRGIYIPAKEELTLGAIIGEISILTATRHSQSAWAENGQWGFELMYPTAYETPIPCKGQQRLWQPPEDIMEPPYTLADFGVCTCGNHFRDHDPETGRCRMHDGIPHGEPSCQGFRLLYKATEIPEPFRS